MKESYPVIISRTLSLKEWQVANTIKLLDEDATIPFISRYRKEATGSLDEVILREIEKMYTKLTELDERRAYILESINAQGKLTDELRAAVESAVDLPTLEDIYLPYKPKRKTRATTARENGLEPLAQAIFGQKESSPESSAAKYICEKYPDVQSVLQGARDIIAEWISEDRSTRDTVRQLFSRKAMINSHVAKGKDAEGATYRDYFDYTEPIGKAPSHRLLALFRGENEGFLKIGIEPPADEATPLIEKIFIKSGSKAAEQIRAAIADGYKRLIAPSIENEFRAILKERADAEAIRVFTDNLRQLLLSPPLGEKNVLAIDPGFRTGCKVVCLDRQGKYLHYESIFPHPPQNEAGAAREKISAMVKRYAIETIAIGNGTAGRETEQFIRETEFDRDIPVIMVSESGASIYSASDAARDEFPDLDVTVRGAISIGRRLVDPLAELVKIDPKSIGVGQYQHDVDQKKLKLSLDATVESCVNNVGVNLNTASAHLLSYVSGLNRQIALQIIAHRNANGPFRSRKDLGKVPRLGEKAFEQCAGFLRIPGAVNPLDNSAVHPESYHIVKKMADDSGVPVSALLADGSLRKNIDPSRYVTETTGLPTLRDILDELEKPGRDPRGAFTLFAFSAEVKTIDDVKPGMILPGIVTNITNFGAFVDIGVKQDGLVHISHIANKFVKDPGEVVSLNQHVMVKVLEVDTQRKRIQLSMKDV
jgi:uncharacterized protein